MILMLFTLVLVCSLVLPTFQQTTKTPKQRYTAEQMSRLRKREAGCGEAHFSPKEIDNIVEYQNTYRSKLAEEKLTVAGKTLGPARNMEKMSWDCELYRSAQNEANDCLHERFPSFLGEGKAVYFHSSHTKSKDVYSIVMDAMGSWIHILLRDEINSVVFDQETSNAPQASQMLWHDSSKVGCGVQTCAVDDIETTTVMCHYSKKGNVHGMSVYDKGPPCPGCPSESICDDNSGLCSYE